MFSVRKLENCADNGDADDHEERIHTAAAADAWEKRQYCISYNE